jgi:predicted TIM-barrel fold metal-dependent hydrolase
MGEEDCAGFLDVQCGRRLKALRTQECDQKRYGCLLFAGVFDRFPKLKIILGHMGETLPYMLWRLDSRAALTRDAR